jgi:hypothetical protein
MILRALLGTILGTLAGVAVLELDGSRLGALVVGCLVAIAVA